MALALVSGSVPQLLFCGERVIAGGYSPSSEANPEVGVCSLSRRSILDVH